MLKLVVPALIAGIFGAAGGAAAVYLKTGSDAPASTSASGGDHGGEKAGSGHDEKPKKSGGHGEDKKAKGGHGGGSSASGDVEYYKFSREFVVPIIADERVKSLVILNLNLQIDSSASDDIFSREPVLRDNIMSTLITLSSDDVVFNSLNSVEHYETIRSMILSNLRESVSQDIQNVLILDMARQDL